MHALKMQLSLRLTSLSLLAKSISFFSAPFYLFMFFLLLFILLSLQLLDRYPPQNIGPSANCPEITRRRGVSNTSCTHVLTPSHKLPQSARQLPDTAVSTATPLRTNRPFPSRLPPLYLFPHRRPIPKWTIRKSQEQLAIAPLPSLGSRQKPLCSPKYLFDLRQLALPIYYYLPWPSSDQNDTPFFFANALHQARPTPASQP